MEVINLRSDTQTLPTPEMLSAMTSAPLGDDTFDEDPTVQKLERMAAERMGKEKALLVLSGTMGNLVALMTHGRPGEEVILDELSHIYAYEAGGLASVAHLMPRTVRSRSGLLDPREVLGAIREPNIHFPRARLLCLENTHNLSGGRVVPLDLHAELCRVAHSRGLEVHLDGARIFNAAVAAGVEAAEYARHADSVMFCLSKGLSCPLGSVLCGSADFITRADAARKRVGGGMRQAGIIAAAGIVALERMVDRLAEDHRTARLLAQLLSGVPSLKVDAASVETNMVLVDHGGTGLSTQDFDGQAGDEPPPRRGGCPRGRAAHRARRRVKERGGTVMDRPGSREIELFRKLVAIPSPSGREEALGAEVRRVVESLGYASELDGAGNITVRLQGSERGARPIILASHMDEIALVVTGVRGDGSLSVDRSGGLLPYKIGERPVDIVGDGELITGVLCMGSAHRERSDELAPSWAEARIITGLTPEELAERGVRVGSSAVPAGFTRGPVLLGDPEDPLVAAWTFDDRMGVVALLSLLQDLRTSSFAPRRPTLICFTVHEEIGCHGAKVVAQRERPEIFVAVDGCPMPPGADLELDGRPGVWSKDSVAHSDQKLVTALCRAAREAGTEAQVAVYDAAASDASKVLEAGAAERVVTFGHVRENSHGYEVARLSVFASVVRTLERFLRDLD